MPLSPRPAWLTKQENGTIGEARTRAFLLDRFWILERSVDIEGADLIIQRRLTGRSLLDPHPPRLGFVQAKFYQDTSTTQYVHKEYVLTPRGLPRDDFFVVAHTGTEAQSNAYFLTAKDIVEGFRLVEEGKTNADRFALPGTQVLSKRYLMTEARRALDCMEASLERTEFLANRRFMAWALPPTPGERAAIDREYVEDIDNHYGSIPKAFLDVKKRAERGYWDLQEVADELRKIIESTDPEKALEIAKALYDEHASMGRLTLRLPDDIADSELLLAVRHHKERYELLQEAGLLNAHATLKRMLRERLAADIAPRMPLDRDLSYVLIVRYDPRGLENVTFETQVVPFADISARVVRDSFYHDILEGVIGSSDGHVEAFLRPGGYLWSDWRLERAGGDRRSWEEKIRSGGGRFVASVMESVLQSRFPGLSD